MSESDEGARLWKVNRTMHQLVRDRVCIPYPRLLSLHANSMKFAFAFDIGFRHLG